MIEGLEPYPEYRPPRAGGVESVPTHWDVLRCRYLFEEVDKRSVDGAETHLSMSQKLGLVPSDQVEQRTLVSASYAGGKLCRSGDLVLNRLKAHLGVFARAQQDGVISPDYTVLRPRLQMDIRYFEMLLRSPACRAELRTRAKGIVEGFWRLYTDDFNDIFLPVPPPDEQAKIVRYLDHVGRRIRHFILAKRKLIRLLSQQRASLIQSEITRTGGAGVQGANFAFPASDAVQPMDRLVSSRGNIPWLYDIPEHWQIVPSKRLFIPRTDQAWPGDVQLSATQAYGVIPQAEYERRVGRKVVKISRNLERRRHVEEGDFVVSMRSFQGGLERAWSRGCIRSSYVVLRPSAEVDLDFFGFLFKSHGYIQALRATSNFIRDGQDLNFRNFCLVDVPLVPLAEQRQIARRLKKAVARIDAALQATREELRLVEELRTRLIADVVTGQLDVRAAAAALPDDLDSIDLTEDEDLDDEDLDDTPEDDEDPE